jgi:hypothetical protein
MKNLFLSLALILNFSFICLSQEKANDEVFAPSIKKGTVGLLFSLEGEQLKANAFNNGIGIKYFPSENCALRGSMYIGYASSNTPASTQNTDEKKTTQLDFGMTFDCSYYLKKGRLNPYIGAGLGIATSSNKEEQGDYYRENYGKGTKYSVFLLGGAEVFLLKELSLSAEYRLSLNSFSAKDNEMKYAGQTVQKTPGTDTFDFETNSVGMLTISFYF